MKSANLNYNVVKSAIDASGYQFYTGPFNLNFVGIRSKNRNVDSWDDFFCMLFQDKHGNNVFWLNDQFTTDPGVYYMQKKLLNPKGCGILKAGQYKGVWTIGLHRGKYEAFVQGNNAPVSAFRDRNLDNYMNMDPKTLDSGYFGCNMHHGYDSKSVGQNSAMCQVHRYKKHLAEVLAIAKMQPENGYGNKFTYTLLEEDVNI